MSEEAKKDNCEQQEEVQEEVKEEQTEKAPKTEKKKKEKKDKKDEKIKELEEALEKEKESRLRLMAEYDNYRKRTSAEKLSIYDDATAKAIEEILPMADSITLALQNMQDAPEEFKKGIELVGNQLKASLDKLKVEAFCEVGDDFDPNIHNAVAKIESEDFEENKISAVFQKGYKIGDKIIRHAMVQVANCD
ncbi:MAG: nucleotide exchange factor GrpE [Ruminococcus sp.]